MMCIGKMSGYVLRVMVVIVAAMTLSMCSSMDVSFDAPVSPEGTPSGPKPKDIPINRPPKGDDLKRLRPRYGIGLQPTIVSPSDSYFSSIMVAVVEYADVEICNLTTGEIYVESLKGGEHVLDYRFESYATYRVRLLVDGICYETEL